VARFDWYQATVGAPVNDVRACLAAMVDRPFWEPQKRGTQGYGFADHLQGPDGTAARLWWGGTHVFPHVVLSGGDAHQGAMLLRQAFPEVQAVTRADVCIDYAEEGAYDRLQAAALVVAGADKIKVNTAGDHLLTMQGRTLYLGAPTSHTRLRLYDKAAQLRGQFAQDPVKLATVPDHLARFEAQVRPQTPMAKYNASKAEPLSLMGSAKWLRKLMGMVAGMEIEPFQAGKVWRQSDDDRAYAALLAQYGGLLSRVRDDLGSWDMVGRQIGDDLAERKRTF
jgi:hypothetical protein